MVIPKRQVRIYLMCVVFFCAVGTSQLEDAFARFPEFGEAENSVTVREGDTAKLPCVVFHLNERSNDRKVIWIRRRDLHILTVGQHTYSADDRFQVVHTESSDEWTLVIQYAQLRDGGIYECQVNTEPKLSRPVTLTVYDSTQEITIRKTKVFVANNTASTKDGHLTVQILGEPERYINEGSSLTLICIVKSSFGPSTLVYWYHDTQLLTQNSPKGGIKLKIDRETGETTSRLTVTSVEREDGGMYSCVPSGSHPASVRVHVTHDGDNEAVIQPGLEVESSCTVPAPFPVIILLLFLLLSLPYLLFDIPVASKSALLLPLLSSLSTFLGSFTLLPLLLICYHCPLPRKQTFRELFSRMLDLARRTSDARVLLFFLCPPVWTFVAFVKSSENRISIGLPEKPIAFPFFFTPSLSPSPFSFPATHSSSGLHCAKAFLPNLHCIVVHMSCSSVRLCSLAPATTGVRWPLSSQNSCNMDFAFVFFLHEPWRYPSSVLTPLFSQHVALFHA